MAQQIMGFVGAMLDKGGKLRILRWTTPLGHYRQFNDWRVASEGDAIWHLPEGPFAYGHLRLTHHEAW